MKITYLKTRSGDVIGVEESEVFRMAGVSPQKQSLKSLFELNGKLSGVYFLADEASYKEAQEKKGKGYNPKESEIEAKEDKKK